MELLIDRLVDFTFKFMKNGYSASLYILSGVLARKTERLANKSFVPVKLTESLGLIFLLVVENPGIQPIAISKQLQLSPSTITRLIDKLEKRKTIAKPNVPFFCQAKSSISYL